MSNLQQLLQLLADGRFHSGEDLARHLGVTRSAVWKSLHKLQELDLELHAVSGKGYRLAAPLELLDAERIRGELTPAVAAIIPTIDVHMELGSTNAHLLEHLKYARHGQVCLAEQQTAGRGRRGRVWHSPFGGNIYLSFVWRINDSLVQPAGASLAVAIGLAQALEQMGLRDIGLKWPNDVQYRGHKLAGILLEMTAEGGGGCQVVAGIGLNLRLPPRYREQIDQAVTDWHSIAGALPPRNALVAAILNHVFAAMTVFQAQGLAVLRDQWLARDVYHGRPVALVTPNRRIEGIARGIDDAGQLLLQQADGATVGYSGGELSLRAVSP